MRKKRILPHIVALIAALFIAGLPHGIGILPTDTVARAAEIDGIGATRERVRRGDTFDIVVNVPATNNIADTVDIRIAFDPTVFEVRSWRPTINGSDVMSNFSNTDGFLALVAANVYANLNNGLTFTASMKVKTNAPLSTYEFKLSRAIVDNYDTKYRWVPQTTGINVIVSNETASVSGNVSLKSATPITAATAVLRDSEGHSVSQNITLGYNTRTGQYEGSYRFDDAESGADYTITVSAPGCRERTETFNTAYSLTILDMPVNMYGDVDGDGDVTALDATQILRFLAGSPSEIKGLDGITDEYLRSVGHVTAGSILNVQDATQILRYRAGFTSVFDGI